MDPFLARQARLEWMGDVNAYACCGKLNDSYLNIGWRWHEQVCWNCHCNGVDNKWLLLDGQELYVARDEPLVHGHFAYYSRHKPGYELKR